jgi:hypothetical protein
MNDQMRVEWNESRRIGEVPVGFHVVATETSQKWCFLEQESLESQSHKMSVNPEAVFIAEYAKEAMARGCMAFGVMLFLVRVDDHGASRYEMSREHFAPEAPLPAGNRTVLRRLRFLRGELPVSISGDEAPKLAA